MPGVVTVYTTEMCGYCMRAKKLLDSKGVAYDEIKAGWDPAKRAEMIQRSGGARTYPQIFIGDVHVGGCDDMMALERRGALDPLLQEQGVSVR